MSQGTVNPPQVENGALQSALRMVPFSKLVLRPEEYSFRDKDEFTGPSVKELAEDIVTNGLLTPFLCLENEDGTFLGLDCHRRWHAIQANIDAGINGFTAADIAVPAHVLPKGTSERDATRVALAANLQRREFTQAERFRAAIRLRKIGMPVAEIARCLGRGESTIARDLAVGDDEQMMGHIQAHHIRSTDAATLMKAAQDGGRVEQFKAAFKAWLDIVLESIQREEDARKEKDLDPLPIQQTYAQRRLTSAQVNAWKLALERNQPLVEVSEKQYTAAVYREDNVDMIEIAALSTSLDKLSAGQLYDITVKLSDVAETLLPLMVQKRHAEKLLQRANMAEQGSLPGTSNLERMKTLGLDEFVAEYVAATTADVDVPEQLPPAHDVAPAGNMPKGDKGTKS
jgi:ParB-like chromosome segregation protein Spo0J